eukprot:GEMP01060840.1.p1 GENE.GEMP01060840.1~~GEMP01060840.1.p1  ORF type:complete len:230 (+),score=42.49 GEMP01060840.1:37-690(+)
MPEGDLPEKYSFKPTADKPELDNSWGNNDAGRSSYTNGDTYTGDFKDGKKHGHGVYVYRNDDEYSGTYVENERHGVGLFTYAAGGKYHGNFSNGKRHGEGTYFYTNGDVYCGEWYEGLKHGKGIYAFVGSLNQKATYSGEWRKGEFVSGQYKLGDNVYKGTFSQQKPLGGGVWQLPGCKVTGKHLHEILPVDSAPDDLSKAPCQEVKVTWESHGLLA